MENERLNKWRPNDWETLDCDKCQCREARCETWCTLYRTYEDAASAMLAARDKWWIEQVTGIIPDPCGKYDTHRCKTDCCDYPCTYYKWQSLKQSLEVKE